MEFTGERFIPNQSGDEIQLEHFQRYHFVKELVKGKIVLDAACGEGYGSAILSESAQSVTGIDIDLQTILEAQKKYQKDNLQFFQANIAEIPFKDASVDVVISFETIEHVNYELQKLFLKEIKRVLKPDGLLVMSTPNKRVYSDLFDYQNQFHIKEFYKDEYETFLRSEFQNVVLYRQYPEVCYNIDLPLKGYASVDSMFTDENAKYYIAVCSNGPISQKIVWVSTPSDEMQYINITKRILELQNEVQEKNNQIFRFLEERQLTIKEIERLNTHIEDLSEWGQKLDQTVIGLRAKKGNLQNKLDENEKYIAQLLQKKSENERHIEQLLESERELERIKSSQGWQLLLFLYKIINVFVPANSKRRTCLRLAKNAVKKPGVYLHAINWQNIKKLRAYIKTEGIGQLNERITNFDHRHSPEQKQDFVTVQVEEGNYSKIVLPVHELPLVSIVIPVYNQFHYTYGCIKSIIENTADVNYEVIIADDNSTDLTEHITEYVENVVICRNESNLGFLRNCNNAARLAKGKYIHFLNNDTNVQTGWLSSLVELIEKNDPVGMVGSKLVYADGRLQEAGGIVWKDASAWNYGRLDSPEKPEYNYVKEVDYISGASIMISRKLWEEIGGFDERFVPAYFEDTDLAFEVRRRGYKVMYQPKSVVVHFEGISHGTDKNSGIKAYQVKNKDTFFEKWKDVLAAEYFSNAENVFQARDRSRTKKTLLMVDHYVPHFDKDAGSRSVFHYLKLFTEIGLNVKFIGDNFYKHEPYTTILGQMGIEVLYGANYHKNWKQWLEHNGKYIDYAFLNRPHISIKYIDIIRELTNAKIMYYGHDLHYLREMREYELTQNTETKNSSMKWKKIEFDIMSKVDAVYFLSNVEIQQIKNENPAINPKIMPINMFEKKPFVDFDKKRQDLLFVGGFGHKPNVDAVLWLESQIMPILRRRSPNIKVYVVGSNPPETVQKLHKHDFIIKGFVTDEELNNFYKRCRLAIVPLRYGAGVKGKVVEAMYNQIPVVTTSIGAEGLKCIEDCLFIADSDEDFANQILRAYDDISLLEEISKKGLDYVQRHLTKESALKTLREDFDI